MKAGEQKKHEGLTIKGFKVRFQLATLGLLSMAEQHGLGEDFAKTWDKLKKDKAEYAKVEAAWPEYVKAVVIDAPDWLCDLKQLTGMEAMLIVQGFTLAGMEIRES